MRTGVALARGACTAYMDADMAIDPRAVPLLLDGLRTSDVAIGSRALADSMVESTYAVRAVMGRLFNRLVTTGTGLGLQRHPVRVQGVPHPGRPAPVPPGAGSTGSPSTSRSWPGPSASGCGSPRSRCSGSTCPGAPSIRCTTRSPCSATSTARGSGSCPAASPVAVVVVGSAASPPAGLTAGASVATGAGGAPVAGRGRRRRRHRSRRGRRRGRRRSCSLPLVGLPPTRPTAARPP